MTLVPKDEPNPLMVALLEAQVATLTVQRDELLAALLRWHPPGTCAVSRSPEYNGGRKSLGCDTCDLLASIETGKEPT